LEIESSPWNTGSNIARNIIAKGGNIFGHTEGTLTNYIRFILKEKFISPDAESRWMRQSGDKLRYEPLTGEEEEAFREIMRDNKRFDNIMEEFSVRFGFIPMSVRKLGEVEEFGG
jgi:hypothetical protein